MGAADFSKIKMGENFLHSLTNPFKRLLIGFKAPLGLRYYFADDFFTSNSIGLFIIVSSFYLFGFLCA